MLWAFYPSTIYTSRIKHAEMRVIITENSIRFQLWHHLNSDGYKVTRVFPEVGDNQKLIQSIGYDEAPFCSHHITKWFQFFPILSESCTRSNADLVDKIMLDELGLKTWDPSKPSWLKDADPAIWRHLMEFYLVQRIHEGWNPVTDAWMESWLKPEVFSNSVIVFENRQTKIVTAIMNS